MLIGEAPGRNEDLQGRPFVGSAGTKLDSLLSAAGLQRDDVFVSNVAKCRPPENRRPTTAESDSCEPYLEREIEVLQPKLVVLLGDTALKRFFPEGELASAHGRLQKKGQSTFFSSYHPAAMIYNRELEKVIHADFRALGDILRRSSQLSLSEE